MFVSLLFDVCEILDMWQEALIESFNCTAKFFLISSMYWWVDVQPSFRLLMTKTSWFDGHFNSVIAI